MRTLLALLAALVCAGCASGPLRPAGPAAARPVDPYTARGGPIEGRPDNLPLSLDDVRSDKSWSPAVNLRTGYILGGTDGPSAFTNGVSLSLSHRFHIASKLTLSVTYDAREYDFEAGEGLFTGLGSAPTSMQTLGASVSLFQPLSREWARFLSGGIAGSTEAGLDPFQDPSLVGIAVLGHQVTPNLQLGLGVLAAARPGEDAFFLPIPNFDWRIDERWRLATEDAGGVLSYRLSDTTWIAGLLQFDTRRYLLDDDGPGTPGIFEDSRTSLALRYRWRPSNAVRVNVIGGLDVLRYLEIADEDGRVLSDERAGIGGFFRVSLSVAF